MPVRGKWGALVQIASKDNGVTSRARQQQHVVKVGPVHLSAQHVRLLSSPGGSRDWRGEVGGGRVLHKGWDKKGGTSSLWQVSSIKRRPKKRPESRKQRPFHWPPFNSQFSTPTVLCWSACVRLSRTVFRLLLLSHLELGGWSRKEWN